MTIVMLIITTILCVLMIISLILVRNTDSKHYRIYEKFQKTMNIIMLVYALIYMVVIFTIK